MSDDVVWRAEQHTLAKHAILLRYLHAWMPILSRQLSAESSTHFPLYVDAFAGPGVYAGGEPGSPIVALEAALALRDLPIPIDFLFIERDRERYVSLQQQVRTLAPRLNHCRHVHLRKPMCGEAISAIEQLLRERSPLGPALFFLDQFGYTDVPMELIGRIMQHERCEVFTYLNYTFLQRFLQDATKDTGRDSAFGSSDWRMALKKPKDQQYDTLLDAYRQALMTTGHARYVWQFAMSDRNHKPLYWLFFATNNLKGLEVMKRAMWDVDPLGTYSFTDADAERQQMLLSIYNNDWLVDRLRERFAGRIVKVEEIRDFVLTETPFYKYADVLQRMKDVVPADKLGRVAYAKDMQRLVRFEGGQLLF